MLAIIKKNRRTIERAVWLLCIILFCCVSYVLGLWHGNQKMKHFSESYLTLYQKVNHTDEPVLQSIGEEGFSFSHEEGSVIYIYTGIGGAVKFPVPIEEGRQLDWSEDFRKE